MIENNQSNNNLKKKQKKKHQLVEVITHFIQRIQCLFLLFIFLAFLLVVFGI